MFVCIFLGLFGHITKVFHSCAVNCFVVNCDAGAKYNGATGDFTLQVPCYLL